jgi:RHS repeat-associated protein
MTNGMAYLANAFGVQHSATGTPTQPFGFAGSWGYQDSGFKLLGHRRYDPSTGRYLTRDPAKDRRNWWSYCTNSPTNSTDSGGLRAISLTDKQKQALKKCIQELRDLGYPETANHLESLLAKGSVLYDDSMTFDGDVVGNGDIHLGPRFFSLLDDPYADPKYATPLTRAQAYAFELGACGILIHENVHTRQSLIGRGLINKNGCELEACDFEIRFYQRMLENDPENGTYRRSEGRRILQEFLQGARKYRGVYA